MVLLAASFAQQASPATSSGGRLRAPETFSCDRNHLTSFTGKVIGYHRSRTGLRIRVATDENTFEKFSLTGTRGALEKQFRFNGEEFTAADWKKVEMSASRTQPKLRVTVWQCEKPKALMVDWKSARESQ